MITEQPVQVGAILWALVLAGGVTLIAQRLGFFLLPPEDPPFKITGAQTVGAFGGFLLLYLLILPAILIALAIWTTGYPLRMALKEIPKIWLSWFQLITLASVFIYLSFYLLRIDRTTSMGILWGSGRAPSVRAAFGHILFGALSWLVSYPIVVLSNLLTGVISFQIWGKRGVNQVAVEQFKASKDHLLLLSLLAFFVIIIVPFIEELLFRGFLQTYFKRILGRKWSIVITAAIFALVHFSTRQQEGNFDLIPTLFILACVLGFVYEKRRSLFASYGLHATFNGLSIVFILLKGN